MSVHKNNLETYSLVWLEPSMNANKEIEETQARLKSAINHIRIFECINECEEFINLSKEDRIIVIINSELENEIIPRIYNLSHVISIYIYCSIDQKSNKVSRNPNSKIKGTFTHLNQLVNQIQIDQTRRNKIEEPISFNILNVDNDDEYSSTSLDGRYIFSHLLIKIFLKMNVNEIDRTEFFNICEQEYSENETTLAILHEFKETYSSEQALYWYSRQTFLYQLLNKALRTQNVDVLISMAFFIRDICHQLQGLFQEQTSIGEFCVYRTQLISDDELNTLKKSSGKLISMNSFLSTTMDQDYTSFIVNSGSNIEGLQNTLIQIDANGYLVGTELFADISRYSHFPEEREVLFMPGNVFQLVDIHRDNEHWVIHLTLRGQYDNTLKRLIHELKEEIGNEDNLCSLGRLLMRSCKWNAAERCFRTYLKTLPYDHDHVAICYRELGVLFEEQGKFDEALQLYEKARELFEQTRPSIHADICGIQFNLGNVYYGKRNWKRALEQYQIVYDMYKQLYGEESEAIASCLTCIGNVYMEEKNYDEALRIQQQALTIKENLLSRDHPELASFHQNISIALCQLGQFDLALEHCTGALTMYEKSLVPCHPYIASVYTTMGNIFFFKHEYADAIVLFEKAFALYSKTLSSSHPYIVHIQYNIENAKSHLIK